MTTIAQPVHRFYSRPATAAWTAICLFGAVLTEIAHLASA